jgi:hypothetical protein
MKIKCNNHYEVSDSLIAIFLIGYFLLMLILVLALINPLMMANTPTNICDNPQAIKADSCSQGCLSAEWYHIDHWIPGNVVFNCYEYCYYNYTKEGKLK